MGGWKDNAMAFLSSLRLILWKNFKLQFRNKTGLIVEILAPLVLFAVVAYVRTTQEPTEVDNVSFAAQALPSAGLPVFVQSVVCGGVSFCDSDDPNSQTPLGRAAMIIRDEPDLRPEALRELLDNVTETLDDLNRSLTELGVDYIDGLGTIDADFDLVDFQLDELVDSFDTSVNETFSPSTFSDEQAEFRRTFEQLCNFYKTGELQRVIEDVLNNNPVGTFQDRIDGQLENSSAAGGISLGSLLAADDPVEALLAGVRKTAGFQNDYIPRLLDGADPNTIAEVQEILANSGDLTTDELRAELESLGKLAPNAINNIVGSLGQDTSVLDLNEPLNALGQTPQFVSALVPALLGGALALPDDVVDDVQQILYNSDNLTNTELVSQLQGVNGVNGSVIDRLVDVGNRVDFTNVSANDLLNNVTEAINNPNFTDATALINQNRLNGSAVDAGTDVVGRLNASLQNVANDFQRLQEETNRTQAVVNALEKIAAIPEFETLFIDLSDGVSPLTAFQKAICPSAMGKDCSHTMTFYNNNWEQSRSRRDSASISKRVRRQLASPPPPPSPTTPASDSANLVESNRFLQDDIINNILNNLTIFYAPKTPETEALIKLANKTFEELATYQQVFHCLATLSNATSFDGVGLNLSGVDGVDSTVIGPGGILLNRTNLGVMNDTNYSFVPYLPLDVWHGFDTIQDMLDEGMRRPPSDVIASIEFHNIDGPGAQLTYKIRMHYQKIPTTKYYARRFPRPGTGGNQGSMYYFSGFLWVQDMIDRAFTDLHAMDDVWSPPSFIRQFPVVAYRRDNFAWGIGRMFPLLFTLAWIYTVAMVCKSVVHEKETRLKEYMKIMGMGSTVHWIGWFITKLSVVTCTCVLLSLILTAGKVCENSDPLVLFVLLELFGISTIILSFLLSTFFSKARLAAACGGIVYFCFYFPYVLVTRDIDSMTRNQKFMACSLSTTAFGLATDYLGKFEEMGVGMQWNNLYDPLSACDNFSMGDAMNMLVWDSIWMMLLTLWIEAVFPGEYGIPLPWYFFISPSYWKGKIPDQDDGSAQQSTEASLVGTQFEPPEPGKKGISLQHLTKKYGSPDCHLNCLDGKKSESIAVNNLSLDMAEGQITSLLGHNGAGKTTTMSILCGLFPPTSGTAFVNGYNIKTEMPQIRGSLGICPQYNVLFDRLTVYESLWFSARLKGMATEAIDAEIKQFLTDLGFADKSDVYTENLSGGMKRKLSVAMAFIGGSKVVILDEPTAGMDPSARRSTWDLLLRYKVGRTLMLSTHHMDEADLLSDRIGIIAKGVIRCVGSSLFLKNAFGAGYTVTIELNERARRSDIDALVAQYIPKGKLVDSTDLERAFVLPCQEQHLFASLFAALEQNQDRLGINGYGITATSLEEVFIQVAEAADDEVDEQVQSSNAHTLPQSSVASKDEENVDDGYLEVEGADAVVNNSPDTVTHVTPTTKISITEQPTFGALKTGMRLWWARFRAMGIKRIQHSLRDRKAVLAQILLPAFFVTAGMWVATKFPPGADLPELNLMDMKPLKQPCSSEGQRESESYVPYVDLDNGSYSDSIMRTFQVGTPGFQEDVFNNLSNVEEFESPRGACGADCMYPKNMSSYLLDSYPDQERFRRVAITMEDAHDAWAGLSLGDLNDLYTTTAHAWFDNRAFHAAPISMGVLNNAILKANSKVSNPSIIASNYPMPKTVDDQLEQLTESFVDLLVAINVMIALSFIPASFVLYLVQERTTKSKHLQFVSGVQPVGYWLANYCWDILNFLVPLAVTLLVFIAYGLPAYTGRNLGTVTMLMLLYGWSITPAMYPFNWLFKVPSTAYVVLIVSNLFLGITCTLATAVLDLFQEDDPSLYDTGQLLQQVFMIFPQFCLGRGLIEIAKNEYIAQFKDAALEVTGIDLVDVPEYKPAWSWDIGGKFLFALFVEAIFFFLFNLAVEFYIQRKKMSNEIITPSGESDPEKSAKPLAADVARERERLLREGEKNSSDVLRVCGLSKVYKSRGTTKLAVDELYFGVPKGQCFGLLGVNGAGKTTTFKMLTGDISLSAGDAQVAGFSVRRGQGLQVKQNLGYCPQFDALDPFLTGRQTLFLYARLRGIEESRIPEVVNWTIERLQLTNWADRISREYSGGNKRKLSVAIGMIGNPPVLFLDEPTSGMDPRARRFLWDMITANVHAGRCVILTSHSMEECDALCSRLAIMVNGQFQCLGSPQKLKSTYGDGYSLIMQVNGMSPNLKPVKQFMKTTFPNAELKEAHHGYIRYHMPRAGLPPLSQIFAAVEKERNNLSLEDYSISQTSLDEIFCNFAKLQNTDRDDQQKIKKKKRKKPRKSNPAKTHVYEMNPAYVRINDGSVDAVKLDTKSSNV